MGLGVRICVGLQASLNMVLYNYTNNVKRFIMVMTVQESRLMDSQERLNRKRMIDMQTKREDFAKVAMNGLLAAGNTDTAAIAKLSVSAADDLMAALAVKPE